MRGNPPNIQTFVAERNANLNDILSHLDHLIGQLTADFTIARDIQRQLRTTTRTTSREILKSSLSKTADKIQANIFEFKNITDSFYLFDVVSAFVESGVGWNEAVTEANGGALEWSSAMQMGEEELAHIKADLD
jgi:hypothetical protein